MRIVTILTVLFLLIIGTGQTALAHMIQPSKRTLAASTSKAELLHKVDKRNLRHAKQALLWYEQHSHLLYRGPKVKRAVHWKVVKAHRWLKEHSATRIERYLYKFSETYKAAIWAAGSGPRCVRSKEGAYTTNTGNGYYGAWQADASFQRSYGYEFYVRWGYANNWPKWAQDVMAYRGWLARGWGPWPNTSVMCGLR